MPRTKKNSEETEEVKKKVSAKKDEKLKKGTTKKESIKKDEKVVKKVDEKKGVAKKSDTKATVSAKKAASKEKNVKEKTTKKTTKKSETVKKVKTAKATKTKKAEKPSKAKEFKPEYLQEYYDLPYRYNETVVKILAQTPKRLFVYWEVSEKDKQTYLNAFGEDFFEKTYPVLLVHNEEMNYTFEVPINDFANSWYLDINDPKTKYVVQLGRKFRNPKDVKVSNEVVKEEHINLQNDFVYITDSNRLEAPNDHILFEKLGSQIVYRDVKTGKETVKDISNILDKLQENYKDIDIEAIYKELYGESMAEELLHNPSSGGLQLTSSGALSRV